MNTGELPWRKNEVAMPDGPFPITSVSTKAGAIQLSLAARDAADDIKTQLINLCIRLMTQDGVECAFI